jgi:hypothetical protein
MEMPGDQMFNRRNLAGLSLVCLVLSIAGCSVSGLDSILVTPATQSLTVGQTAQFIATGTYGNATKATTQTITTGVTWTSSAPAVATVDSTGIATAVGAGTTTISASAAAFRGPVISSATLTVTGSSGGVAGGTISSITIIPGVQAVASPTQTTQFLAIGTTSSGNTVNLTNQVAWNSSSTQIATVGAATGLATAVGQGSATITAIYTNTAGGTVVTGTATFTVSGGTTQQYTAVSITPGSQALSASGQTAQFIALATSGSTGNQLNVTNSSQLTWSSPTPSIVSISTSGLATGLSVGNATISAQLTNPDGSVVSATATVAVSLTAAPENLLSLTVIPSSITVGNLQDTGQFLAVGTFSTVPYVRDLTNSPTLTWISVLPSVFPVSTNPVNTNPGTPTSSGNQGATAGIVTAYGAGSATIIAEATGSDGTIQTATATFNCPQALANPNGDPPTLGTCVPGTQAPALLSTLTIYNEGLNTTNWQVTAPSATALPNDPPVLHCGPGWALNGGAGGSVCTATYPLTTNGNPTVIVLTAPKGAGLFGGWSYNCTPSDINGNPLNPSTITEGGPNYCVVTFLPVGPGLTGGPNITVGAIFN